MYSYETRMFRQASLELFGKTVFRMRGAVVHLVAHARQMAFQAHSPGDPFGGPASFEAILDGNPQF